MTDVSKVTFDETQPAEVLTLGLHALQDGAGMQTRATIPQVVAWIRALPDAAASEFWSLACDVPPNPWSWLAAAHAPTPAERLVAHVKAQPDEVRLAVLNGAFGGSLTAAIVADERERLERDRDQWKTLYEQLVRERKSILEQHDRQTERWKIRGERAETSVVDLAKERDRLLEQQTKYTSDGDLADALTSLMRHGERLPEGCAFDNGQALNVIAMLDVRYHRKDKP